MHRGSSSWVRSSLRKWLLIPLHDRYHGAALIAICDEMQHLVVKQAEWGRMLLVLRSRRNHGISATLCYPLSRRKDGHFYNQLNRAHAQVTGFRDTLNQSRPVMTWPHRVRNRTLILTIGQLSTVRPYPPFSQTLDCRVDTCQTSLVSILLSM